MNKGGRPTKLTPEMFEQVRNYCSLGASDRDLINFLGIAESTLYKWRAENEEFAEATRIGKEAADARVGQALYSKACGYDKDGKHYPPDTVSMIFWLKNRQPDVWKDVKERVNHHHMDTEEVNPLELARRIAFIFQEGLNTTH